MDWLLLGLAALAAIGGFFSLSQATLGVGLLAGACLLAILARMVQASHHHRALLTAVRQQPVPTANSGVVAVSDTWVCQECGRAMSPQALECSRCGERRPAY